MIDLIIDNLYLSDVYDIVDESGIDRIKNDLKVFFFGV